MVEIRKLENKDIEQLCALYDELLETNGNVEIMRDRFLSIDNDPNNNVIVACIGDEVVGTLQYTLIPSLAFDGAPHVAVEYFIVKKEHRKKGIGRKLFEKVMSEASSHNVSSVFLVSGIKRVEAHKAYISYGLDDEVVGFRKVF